MGSELNLTPLVVFLSVLAWAWILGPAGALLAVPLTVGLVAILEAYPSGARIAALLRNRLDERPGLPDLVPETGGIVVATSTTDVARPADDGDGRLSALLQRRLDVVPGRERDPGSRGDDPRRADRAGDGVHGGQQVLEPGARPLGRADRGTERGRRGIEGDQGGHLEERLGARVEVRRGPVRVASVDDLREQQGIADRQSSEGFIRARHASPEPLVVSGGCTSVVGRSEWPTAVARITRRG